MSFPHALVGLTDREAITDALYRAILAFDNNDPALLASAMVTKGATFLMGDNAFEGIEQISGLVSAVGPLDTTHTVSTVRIDVKPGASTASLTATAVNQHAPKGQGLDPTAPKFTAGSTYALDLVKEEQEWKIKSWKMNMVWTQGDPSVMPGSS